MADNPETKSSDLIPPKLDLRKSGIPQGQAPSAAAAGIPSASTGLTSKRETSHIPLDLTKAVGAAEAAGTLKTIRIKPTGAPDPARSGGPEGGAPAAVEPPIEKLTAAKRTTSRISLEAVLGEAGEAGRPGDGAPKTIRLKRPGEAPVMRMGQPGAGPSEESVPQTVRKTVRVKRAPGGGGPQPMSVSRAAGAAQRADVAAMAAATEPVGVISPLVALAAIAAAFLVIWMLCAQYFGPDVSLTPLSSGTMRGMDLPWPGKVAAAR